MGDRIARAGGSSVTISGVEEEILRVLEQVAPAVREAFEREAQGLIDAARVDWPVRTGASKAGLQWETRVRPDFLETIISNAESYAYKIRFSRFTRDEVNRMEAGATSPGRKRRVRKLHGTGAPSAALAGEHAWSTLMVKPSKAAEKRLVDELSRDLERL